MLLTPRLFLIGALAFATPALAQDPGTLEEKVLPPIEHPSASTPARELFGRKTKPDPVAARARRSAPLEGEIPSPLSAPSGCVFRTRCPLAIERCTREVPALRPVGASLVACHRAEENVTSPVPLSGQI